MDEFRAYARGGPGGGRRLARLRLQRECVQILEENRRAAEAAKEMQLDAEQKAAEEAPEKSGQGAGKQATGAAGAGVSPTSTQEAR